MVAQCSIDGSLTKKQESQLEKKEKRACRIVLGKNYTCTYRDALGIHLVSISFDSMIFRGGFGDLCRFHVGLYYFGYFQKRLYYLQNRSVFG